MDTSLIVHLAPFLQGGAGRTITTLACDQRRRGHDVMVCTSLTHEPGFENYAEYLDTLDAAGVPCLRVDSLFKRDAALNARALDAIRARLGERRPTIVHGHAAIAARIGTQLGAPVIQTMHGWSRQKSAAHTAEDLGIMRRLDAIVFPSHAAMSELVEGGARFARTDIVPCGIDAHLPVTPVPPALADLAHARPRRVLLTIGSLTTQKNHRIVVDAMPAILERHDVMAVFVGEGPELQHLQDRSSALGLTDRVRFTGYLPAAAAALQVADLLIQPSFTESFGISVLEAFRARVPVVASRIPALQELVDETACGWMFDPASADSLAVAVRAALDTEDRAVITRAHELFHHRYTRERMCDGYDAIIAQCQAVKR